MFLKSENCRRSSSEPAGPAVGWLTFNWRLKRVPFCPKYETFRNSDWRTGYSIDALHCCRYGFGKCVEAEKILGCTDGVEAAKAVVKSNCGKTGPLFFTSK